MQATGQINAVQRAHINIQKSQIVFCQRQSTQLRCICGAIHRGARHLRLYDGLYLFRQLTGKGCVVIANQYAHGKILLFGIFARRVLAGICCKHNLLPPCCQVSCPKSQNCCYFSDYITDISACQTVHYKVVEGGRLVCLIWASASVNCVGTHTCRKSSWARKLANQPRPSVSMKTILPCRRWKTRQHWRKRFMFRWIICCTVKRAAPFRCKR